MGLHRIKYNFIINLCEHGGKVIILLLLFLISVSIENVIIAFSLAFALASSVGAWIIYHNFYKHLPQSTSSYTSAILRYSLPLFFISLGFLLLTEVDTMMLGILTNDSEVGIYAVPKQFSIKVPQIALALAMGSMPVFAQLSSDNKERLQKLFQKLLLINSGIMLIFLIGVFSLSHWLIPLIFGESYMASVPVLYVLSLYTVMNSFAIIFAHFLDYQGYAQRRAWSLSITMISNIILNLILIPEYGVLGAAIGTTISYVPYTILNSLAIYNVFRKY